MRVKTIFAALLAGGCATMELQQPEPEGAVEVRVQMQVKAALLESEEVAAAPIRVEYEGDRLILRGFVETEAERRRAAEIAEEAQPGLEIVNELEVWGLQGQETASADAAPPQQPR